MQRSRFPANTSFPFKFLHADRLQNNEEWLKSLITKWHLQQRSGEKNCQLFLGFLHFLCLSSCTEQSVAVMPKEKGVNCLFINGQGWNFTSRAKTKDSKTVICQQEYVLPQIVLYVVQVVFTSKVNTQWKPCNSACNDTPLLQPLIFNPRLRTRSRVLATVHARQWHFWKAACGPRVTQWSCCLCGC